MEPDAGATNVRNTASSHWKAWLGPANRALVPFTAFSEPGRDADGRYRPVWFSLPGDEPLAFFAGIQVPQWTSVRKIRTGLETLDPFAFLTTEPRGGTLVVVSHRPETMREMRRILRVHDGAVVEEPVIQLAHPPRMDAAAS